MNTKRDLISIQDLATHEIDGILTATAAMKKDPARYADALAGYSVALVFQKPSNRTRVSFEIGIWQLGGKCLYLSPREINLGVRESTADVAKTLSRYVQCIVARTNSQDDVLKLALESSVPVINGLSDLFHPCQGLADIFTIREKLGTRTGITLAYIGDGNNVCHSLMFGCAKTGIHLNIATPPEHAPHDDVLSEAKKYGRQSGAEIRLTRVPQDAIAGAHAVYTDTWVSMGQEGEEGARLAAFKGFQINAELMSHADKKCIFMHCLPAHRGQEVTDEVMDGPHSVVFDQAENRMHVQKALLLFLLKAK